MNKVRRVLKYCIVIFVILIFSGEIFLRITSKDRLRRFKYQKCAPDSLLGYTYKPYAEDYKITPALENKYKINSKGFHTPEFGIGKKSGTFRIMLLGYSDDTGIVTDGPDNYVKLLRDYFRENGDKIEIINLSIDGTWRAIKNIRLIKSFCIKYNPDLIMMREDIPIRNINSFRTTHRDHLIVYYDYNRSLDSVKQAIDQHFYTPTVLNTLHDASYLFRYLGKYTIESNTSTAKYISQNIFGGENMRKIHGYARRLVHVGREDAKSTFLSFDESLELLKETDHFLAEKNIDFALFNTYAYPSDPFMEILLKQNGIGYVNVSLPFKLGYNFGKIEGHSSQKGHEAIAQKFHEELMASGLIPNKFLSHKSKVALRNSEANFTLSSNEIRLDLSRLKSLQSGALAKDSGRNAMKVLFFLDTPDEERLIENTFIDPLQDHFRNNEDRIEVVAAELPFPETLDQYLQLMDKEIIRHNPDLVISHEPRNIIENEIQESIKTVGSFGQQLATNEVQLAFYNLFKDNTSFIITHLLNEHSISTLNPGLGYADKPMREKLAAEYLFNEIRSKFSSEEFLSTSVNLAQNKTVYSSSSPENWGWFRANVVDGVRSYTGKTKGWTTWKYKESVNHTEWLIIDLDSIHRINKIILYPRDDEGRQGNGFPIDFTVDVSADSIHWNKIIEESNYLKPDQGTPQYFHFDPKVAKYVRISGTNLREEETNRASRYEMTFSEIEIFAEVSK